MADGVLDAIDRNRIGNVAREPYHEQIAEALVKDYLGRGARVGTSKNYCEGMLRLCEGNPPGGVVRMRRHSLYKSLIPIGQKLKGISCRNRGFGRYRDTPGQDQKQKRSCD